MKPNTRSTTAASVTKGGIKSMLWSTYNTNSKYSSNSLAAKRPSIIVQVRYIEKFSLENNNDDNDNNDNNNNYRKLWSMHHHDQQQQQQQHQHRDEVDGTNRTYMLYLSDNEFTVMAIAEESTFQKIMMISSNNISKTKIQGIAIQRIEDIPLNTYICIEDYIPTFSTNYKHCICIYSFRIRSYYHHQNSTSSNSNSKTATLNEIVSSLPPPFVDDSNRSDILVLQWVQWIKDNTHRDKFQDNLFRFKGLGSNETRIIADALRGNTTLTHLHYGYSRMGNIGMEYLVDALQDNDTIIYLNVSDNKITYPGVKALAMYLKNNNPRIQTLDVSWNSIGGRGGKILASALDNNTTLNKLAVMHGKITTCGIVALGNMLKFNRTLVELNLSKNEISDEGTCAIASSLWYNHTLQRLDLSGNHFGTAGVTALAKALKYNTGLTQLRLKGTNIPEKVGIVPIYDALEYNTTLQVLLHGTYILRPYPDGDDRYIQLQEEYNTIMRQLMDYNDTLTELTNLEFPRCIKRISLRSNRCSDDDDNNSDSTTTTTTNTDRVAPKKGQRQKHDIYTWLFIDQQNWPTIRNEPKLTTKKRNRQQRQQRQSKRLQY